MPALLAAEWWHTDWRYRVRIPCKPGEGDVAFVHIALAGRTTPDGRDLRLVDGNGRPRAFEIIRHDSQLSTLIRFRVPPDTRLTTWLYYGNRDAEPIKTTSPLLAEFRQLWQAWSENAAQRNELLKRRANIEAKVTAMRERLRDAEEAGRTGTPIAEMRAALQELEQELAVLVVPEALPEPKKPTEFKPRRGVLLRVYRKSEPGHPETLRELRHMIKDAALEGAGFRAGVSDGFNPFGTSENYISVYEGYLRIDQPGEYAFCTVSDDGSWVIINKKTVVTWPGGHGIDGAQRGEVNGTIKLRAGVAHVQYFQEEDSGGQMAFLGWRPPGAERFKGIPPDQWLGVRRARAGNYEAHDKPLLAVPHVQTLSTYWIRDTEELQATMVRFTDHGRSSAAEITRREWSFGDGLHGTGREVEHVYFRLGRPEVTLTVTDAAGNHDSVTCAPHLFQTDAVARSRKYGNSDEYFKATCDYDARHMERDDLALYIEFCGNLEQWPQHLRAARAYIARFPTAEDASRVALSAAESCLQPQAYDPRLADELLQRVLREAESNRDRLNLMLRRAHVLAWHLDRPRQAKELYQVLRERAENREGRYFKRLRRAVQLGEADLALVTADYGQAEELYRLVEETAEQRVEQAEKLAKTGGYAYTVEDLLYRGQYKWAREVLDKWEDQFPLQKLEGLTFFLRGKVLFVEHPGELALRYLDLAERVAPRAVHVPEAVWLRANCYLALKRYEDARAELQRITVDFTYTEFLAQALEKLKECEAKPRKTKK
ncbi:MAG: PKD domain-containing protein [Phycisphaerae bacterium]|nr:PKD domain-containing protein [Phycisphaerae bacterium]